MLQYVTIYRHGTAHLINLARLNRVDYHTSESTGRPVLHVFISLPDYGVWLEGREAEQALRTIQTAIADNEVVTIARAEY